MSDAISTDNIYGDVLDPVLDASSVAVMSDLHLGADNCVLNDTAQLDRLVDQFRINSINVDVLVLNGDLFDFTLATMDRTVDQTKTFVRRLGPFCRTFVYVPGNHDHHLWLLANELHELLRPFPNVSQQYLRRTERMYRSTFLQRLVEYPEQQILVAYPNLYWSPPNAHGHMHVFHHGHYCEELYSIVWQTINDAFPGRVPPGLESIEAASFGWLEMIWYQLGQAGRGIGADGLIESLYQQIRERGPDVLIPGIRRVYDVRIAPIVQRALADAAHRHWYFPNHMANWIGDYANEHIPNVIVSLISAYGAHKKEQSQPGASAWRFRDLDEDIANHCWRYLEITAKTRTLPAPEQLSFFFGHTHRAGKLVEQGRATLFNDGGWIFESDGKTWPQSHVLVLDDRGGVKDLYFGETNPACVFADL